MFLDLGIKPAYPRTSSPASHGFSPFCAVSGCDFRNLQRCGAVPKNRHPRPKLSLKCGFHKFNDEFENKMCMRCIYIISLIILKIHTVHLK
jgi:hypothetical protein